MLNQQHGVLALEPAKQFHHQAGFLAAHAGHGLIKQQQFGSGHQHHGQLKLAPLAMGQLSHAGAAALGQAGLRNGAVCRLYQLGLAQHRGPKTKTVAAVRLHGQGHVLQHRELGKHRGDLKRSGQAQQGPLRRGQAGDVAPVKQGAATVGPNFAGELPNQGGFARAVGADDRMQLARRQGQRNMVGGEQAAIAFDQLLELQQRPHSPSPDRPWRACLARRRSR